MQEYQDKELTCLCGKKFTFRAKDQAFFASMGYTEPRRCRPCVNRKKQDYAERENETPVQRAERIKASPFHPNNIKNYSGPSIDRPRRHSDREFLHDIPNHG